MYQNLKTYEISLPTVTVNGHFIEDASVLVTIDDYGADGYEVYEVTSVTGKSINRIWEAITKLPEQERHQFWLRFDDLLGEAVWNDY